MNKKTTLKHIRQKFHNCVWFSTVTGVKLSRLRSYFGGKLTRETEIEFELELYAAMGKSFVHPLYITPEERERIRQRIAVGYKSNRAFCQQHKKFNQVWVSNIITGRKKRKDQKFNELMRVLG